MEGQRPRYTQAEVNAILKRALERSEGKETLDDGFSHDELVETAREVGIAPEHLDTALAEARRDREVQSLRDEWLAQRRAALHSQLRSMLVLSTLAVGFAVAFHNLAFLAFLGFAALILVMSGLKLRGGPSPRELDKIADKRERRLARQRRREHFDRSIAAVGDAVEKGARALADALDAKRRR